MFLLLALACTETPAPEDTGPQDSDGDGVVDSVDCAPEDPAHAFAVEVWTDGDGDGFGGGDPTEVCIPGADQVLLGGDCDDQSADIHPDADEVCDGSDNDCDGSSDEGAIDESAWYPDFDGDGYGDGARPLEACSAPLDYVADASDCDDTRAEVSPAADEVCNGLDDNCDGQTDEAAALDAQQWYADADGDGYGDAGTSQPACSEPEGWVSDATDCDDTEATVYPSAEELCDGLDNDCDGSTDHDAYIPGDYSDVQDAMANAPSGAHICIDAGTYTGAGYSRTAPLTLQGAGVDQTVLEADGQRWMTLGAGGAITLMDMDIQDASTGTQGPGGGLVLAEDGGSVTLERVRLTDLACASTYSCSGTAVYLYSGDLTLRDVEVDGIESQMTYAYATYWGTFVVDVGSLTIDGLEVHSAELDALYRLFGVGFGTWEASVDAQDISVHDISVEAERIYSFAAFINDTSADTRVQGLAVEDSTLNVGLSYGQLGITYHEATGLNTLTNLSIQRNTIDSSGRCSLSGLISELELGSYDIQNVLIADNQVSCATTSTSYFYAAVVGYELDQLTLSNVDMVNNSITGITQAPAALLQAEEGSVEVWNTTLSGNTFDGVTPDSAVVLYNSAYSGGYNNVAPDQALSTWVYDDDAGTSSAAQYNVTPSYVDAATYDYTLASTSPLIDAGTPSLTDADGSVSDVGAYGGPLGASW